MSTYHVWKNHTFDPVAYGTGGASLLGGGGLSRFLKGKVGANASSSPAP